MNSTFKGAIYKLKRSGVLLSMIVLISLLIIPLESSTAVAQQTDPGVRARAAVEKLTPLLGSYQLISDYSSDGGKSWTKAEPTTVNFRRILKGMGIREVSTSPEVPVFHLDTTFSYDQYRSVYRVMVLDDTWGVMDIYEGTIKGGALIVTNIRAQTGFPISADVTRYFRLTFPITSGKRVMTIDASDDGGKNWMPNFKVTYNPLDD